MLEETSCERIIEKYYRILGILSKPISLAQNAKIRYSSLSRFFIISVVLNVSKVGLVVQPIRQEGKREKVVITFLAPALAIFFAAFLIFHSGVLRPGGIWLKKPDTGNVITENRITLKLSAYSYTLLPLDRVEVVYWHEGINSHTWNKLCVLQPRSDRTYTCDFDFSKLRVPVGKKILISFDVYGILMNKDIIGRVLVN